MASGFINKSNQFTTKNLKNKAVLNLEQYCMHCYVCGP